MFGPKNTLKTTLLPVEFTQLANIGMTMTMPTKESLFKMVATMPFVAQFSPVSILLVPNSSLKAISMLFTPKDSLVVGAVPVPRDVLSRTPNGFKSFLTLVSNN